MKTKSSISLIILLFFSQSLSFSQVTSINGDATGAQNLYANPGAVGGIIDFTITDDLAGKHYFNFPDASNTARGLVTTGTQTFGGAKTFSSSLSVSGTSGNTFAIETSGFVYDATNNRIGINKSNPQYFFDLQAPSSTVTYYTHRNSEGNESLLLDFSSDNIRFGLIDSAGTTAVKLRSNSISFIQNHFMIGDNASTDLHPQFKVVGTQDFTSGNNNMINYQSTIQQHSETIGKSASLGFGVDSDKSSIGAYISFIRTANPSKGGLHFGVYNSGGSSIEDIMKLETGQISFYGKIAYYTSTIADGELLIGNTLESTFEKTTLTAGSGTTITNGSGSIIIDQLFPHAGMYLSEEFFIANTTSGAVGQLGWINSSTGNGAAVSANPGTSGRPGQVKFETGITSAGRAVITFNTTDRAILLGGGEMTYETSIYIEDLSTVGEEYIDRIGFGYTVGGDQVNGAYFEYNRLTSTNWVIKTADGGTITSTTTSTSVVEDSWIKLKIVVNADASQVDYFVNGSNVGNITTNIPTTNQTSVIYQIIKSAGSTSRTLIADYFNLAQVFTTAR